MPQTVRCLTLWQPWATLIADGIKIHETRAWPAPKIVVGAKLAIHAAVRPVKPGELDPEIREELRKRYGSDWADTLPRGHVLGVGRLLTCEQMPGAKAANYLDQISGDWTPGRWAWRIDRFARFAEPRAARGLQGLWKVEIP